jgi:tungstate transport system substrate-binding protein
MRRRPLAVLVGLGISLALGVGSGCSHDARVVPMATTTTIDNSGLLSVLLPALKSDLNLDVRAVAVASGRALEILERRDADVGFTHDPDTERIYRDKGVFGDYRKVMYNDFVIAGPGADPANAKAASSAADAMGRVADSHIAFASRADSSGTHSRELLLWKNAGRRPVGETLIETGQGMSATLRIASERQAYVLTDRATFTQMSSGLRLAILYAGDSVLINTYAVSYRKGLTGARLEHARNVMQWLCDGRGRDVINGFLVKGQPAFYAWPLDKPRSQPGDLPDGR